MYVAREAEGGGTGSARRRRERRLRAYLRHERMTVAMALAEKLDHSSRGQRMARAGEEDLELHYTAEFRTHPPPQAAGTVYFAMDVDDVLAALGSRPDRHSEVRPQERAQRLPLLTFDDPAPQMVGQLLNLAHFLDTPLPDPEQVIEVPKILSDDVPMRTPVRDTQLGWWKCRRSCPIPGCCYEWSKPSTFQFLVVEGEFLVFKVFFQDRVQQRCKVPWNAFLSGLWSRTFISLLVEVSKIFSQDRVHLQLLHLQLVFMVLQMSLEKGGFALFPKLKRVRSWAGTAPRVEPIHAGRSCGRVVGSGASGRVTWAGQRSSEWDGLVTSGENSQSGVWLFRGALSAIFSFVAFADWVKKGSFLTAWAVPLFRVLAHT